MYGIYDNGKLRGLLRDERYRTFIELNAVPNERSYLAQWSKRPDKVDHNGAVWEDYSGYGDKLEVKPITEIELPMEVWFTRS